MLLSQEDQNTSDKKPQDYFYTAFAHAIAQIGRTVTVLAPLKHPRPLRRSWCVWEMFCTVNAGAELVVATEPSARKVFERMLLRNFGQLLKIVSGVRTENCQAFSPVDQARCIMRSFARVVA